MVFRSLQRLLGQNPTSSPVEVLPDRVWLSREAKLAGIRREIDERIADGSRLIALVAHFPDVFEAITQITSAYVGPVPVRPVLSHQLSLGVLGDLPFGESNVVDLIAAERHPLASRDDALIEFARKLPCRCRVVFHLSFDDPLLGYVGGQRLVQGQRELAKQLRVSEAEAITSAMLTKSIRGVQRKIEARSINSFDAESAADWIEYNVRN